MIQPSIYKRDIELSRMVLCGALFESQGCEEGGVLRETSKSSGLCRCCLDVPILASYFEPKWGQQEALRGSTVSRPTEALSKHIRNPERQAYEIATISSS